MNNNETMERPPALHFKRSRPICRLSNRINNSSAQKQAPGPIGGGRGSPSVDFSAVYKNVFKTNSEFNSDNDGARITFACFRN